MKQVVSLMVRLSIVGGFFMALWLVPFALALNLLMRASISSPLVDLSIRPALLYAIGFSLAGGILLGVTIGIANYIAVRAVIDQSKPIDLRVVQSRIIQIQSDWATAYHAGELALSTIGARITILDKDGKRLEGRTRMSWKSVGELVSVRVSAITETDTQVTIQSRPALRTTMADFGKNYENVEGIVREYARGNGVAT